ncbi:erythromycin esterase family protein [Empedobacter brevis]|uniref:erythromycin esterase family protein n=1 Tax=Empedobacter brevis TaxID=247 RepID=UPI00289AC2EB|nr:erythromycin esterase family protein [Empedobacter brevis]
MKNLTTLILSLTIVHLATAQAKTDFSKQYIDNLYKNSSKIRSISPNNTNFKDLEPIGKSIGDAGIVLLGEPSHGDGGAIRMKTRLVKYLHEQKNFDVLLFEADLYAIMFGLADIKDPVGISVAAKENIYTCWSESNVSQDLWNYYQNQLTGTSPLLLGGFDPRHAGNFSKTRLTENLTRIAKESHFDTGTDNYKRLVKDIDYILQHEFSSKKEEVAVENFSSEITAIEESVKFNTADTHQRKLWLIEINNIRNLFDMIILGKNRDILMAENFIFISKYIFPGKKIMVWSHNNHNVLDVNTYVSFSSDFAKQWYANGTYNYFTYFGTEIFKIYGSQVYSLAITSGSGNFSPLFFGSDYFHADFTKTAKVPVSTEGSLEKYLENKKSGSIFLPLPQAQGSPSGYPWFTARLFDLTYEAKMDYTSSFNGIIYIDKTVDLNGQ